MREVAEEVSLTDTRYGAYLGQEAYAFTDHRHNAGPGRGLRPSSLA